MTRRSTAVAVALLFSVSLSGCTSFFYPAYDATADQSTATALKGVAKIAADADLGKYTTAASFADAESQYSDITAALTIAALRAGNDPASKRGTAMSARDAIVQQINDCKQRVMELVSLHKSGGLQPASGVAGTTLVSCNQAARAVHAMKGGA